MYDNENLVKVLVVSDDLILPDCLENMLNPHRFAVDVISPNPKAIAEIGKESPDVFVLDSMNSGGDVLGLCQSIRYYSRMPIVVFATSHKPELVERVLDAGADEFLVKPVSGKILTAYLNTLTRRARAERDAALSSANGGDGKTQQASLLTY